MENKEKVLLLGEYFLEEILKLIEDKEKEDLNK
jgi:hypothetical protein|nr:MAG TPA: hypothetical protein [Caudoviricetes sp.]